MSAGKMILSMIGIILFVSVIYACASSMIASTAQNQGGYSYYTNQSTIDASTGTAVAVGTAGSINVSSPQGASVQLGNTLITTVPTIVYAPFFFLAIIGILLAAFVFLNRSRSKS